MTGTFVSFKVLRPHKFRRWLTGDDMIDDIHLAAGLDPDIRSLCNKPDGSERLRRGAGRSKTSQ